ncbi:hypothetical protein FRB95_005647, partial [Tulasnella sp. JGI-2019a]
MQSLTRNICDLDPSLLNSEVKDLSQRIRERILPPVQYACVYVAAHVCQTVADSADIRALVARFTRERLMYWLEVLSLMGRAHEAVDMVASIESWLMGLSVELARAPSDDRSQLQDTYKLDDLTSLPLLYDFCRFILEFMDPIVTSTPHIYLSALALMPSETGLSRQYGHLAEGGVRAVRGRARQWSRTLWTASKHSGAVNAVAMFPDGTTIVSGSNDKALRLWDAKTGAAVGQAMEGHTDWVRCVAISPDGTRIVSGSDDKTVWLWDAKTGAAVGQAMKGHTDWVHSVVISPDSTTTVSGSDDKTLQLWDAKTGVAIGQAMKGHNDWVRCAAISPNGMIIVSGSYGMTLQLWDAKTGVPIGQAME